MFSCINKSESKFLSQLILITECKIVCIDLSFGQHQDALLLEVNIGFIFNQYLPHNSIYVCLPLTQVNICLMSATCFLLVHLENPDGLEGVWRIGVFCILILSLLSIFKWQSYTTWLLLA